MIGYNPRMKIEAELRPCLANGKNAFFHYWCEHEDSLLTIAIVEYVDDGRVEPVLPHEIRFLDTKGKAMGYCWDNEKNEGVKVEWDGGMYNPTCSRCGYDSLEIDYKHCPGCGTRLIWESESE